MNRFFFLSSLLAALVGCANVPASSSTDSEVIELAAGGAGKADLVGTLPVVKLDASRTSHRLQLRCGTNPNASACSVKMTVKVRAFDASGAEITEDGVRVARVVPDSIDRAGDRILLDKDVRLAFAYEGNGSLELRPQHMSFEYGAPKGTHSVRLFLVPATNVARVEVELVVEAREYFGGGGCFVAGTPIATPNGDRPIEELLPGDIVWAYDDEQRTVVPGAIVETRVRPQILYGEVETSDGTILEVSEEHPFFRAEYGDYVRAIELEQGTWVSRLVEGDGVPTTETVTIERVDFSADHYADVYNFDVDVYDNYFARNILVHNY